MDDIAWCQAIWPKLQPAGDFNQSQIRKNCNQTDSFIIWDLIIAFTLVFGSILANCGLLYLAKITRRSSNAKSPLYDLSYGVYVTNLSRPQRLSESACSYMPNRKNVSAERYRRKSTTATLCTDNSVLIRLSQEVEKKKADRSKKNWRNFLNLVKYSNKSSQRNYGRKSGRYLKGLIVIAISNLVIAFCLTIWFVREIIIRFYLKCINLDGNQLSHKLLPLIDLIMADIAQSIEIGAVLWIALDRTMAIQWPMQRKVSANSTTLYSPQGFCPSIFDFSAKPKRQSFKELLLTTWRRGTKENEEDGLKKCGSFNILWNFHAKRITSFIKIFLCLTPSLLMLVTMLIFSPKWYDQLNQTYFMEKDMNSSRPADDMIQSRYYFPFIYYNPGVLIMLIYGHFLIPFFILLVTSLIIYHKVSRRELPFTSRQASCTSKFSEVSSPNIENRDRLRREFYTVLQKSVEVDSESEAQTDTVDRKKISFDEGTSPEDTPESEPQAATIQPGWRNKMSNRFLTKGQSVDNKLGPAYSGSNANLQRFAPEELRASTLSLNPFCETNIFKQLMSKRTQDSECHRSYTSCYPTPQGLRKNSYDQSRNSSQPKNSTVMNQDNSFDSLFYQLIRNQHRRTWKILIVLLLGFLISKGPRALILFLGWFNLNHFCQMEKNMAEVLLRCVNLWAHLSMILDPIVYGFWGNRTFRVKLKLLFFHQIFRREQKNKR